MSDLKNRIGSAFQKPASELTAEDRQAFDQLLAGLESGSIRAAEPGADGSWSVNHWVKQGILVGFRLGIISDQSTGGFPFFDKNTYPMQNLNGVERSVRIVPGGSSVRRGAFLGKGVTCMPPMYINVGAFVDEGTMVDSHALVGSCAQIGKRVHLSAAAQIGGVLEPVNALPVIIEDDVMVGGNTGIYEGTVVKRGAVIGTGVILTASTPVYDLVNETVYRRTEQGPLTIPVNAVVVQGSRSVKSDFAQQHGLAIYTPVIIKYKDDKTTAAVALESALRPL
ncbi:MAG: 2,3,4,5-tetrahydropyridine-2,6-dicarboxylate N-succinyltransferase [Bacteroidetes bacterium]|nr:2,3,4,5-tetrahydropyridine-2,6-dicarboxylate N-succinyltransferase [Bacteroidota bacterium]